MPPSEVKLKMSFIPEKITASTSKWENPKKVAKRKCVNNSPNSSFETENLYNVLDEKMQVTLQDGTAEDAAQNSVDETEKLKIPPIVVHSFVNNHMKTLNEIKKDMKEDFDIKSKANRIIIKTKNLSDYNVMLKKVSESKVDYHTYSLPSEKTLKLVLKGIAPNVPSEDIKNNLVEKGLTVNNVKQFEKNVFVDGQKTVTKLPIFIVEFGPNTNPKDVYKNNTVCYCVVRWEKLQNGNRVVQCFNCQCFGHISKNCHKQIKCVLCAENHTLKDCPFKELKNQELKCANCGESHSAGSRDCRVYKTMLENKLKKTTVNDRAARTGFRNNNNSTHVRDGRSYSQAADGSKQRQNFREEEENIDHMSFGDILEFLRNIMKNFNLSNIVNIFKKMLVKIKRADDSFSKIMCVVEAFMEFF